VTMSRPAAVRRRVLTIVSGGAILAIAFAVGGAVASDAFYVVAGVLGGVSLALGVVALFDRQRVDQGEDAGPDS
jgi:hypothetical protein